MTGRVALGEALYGKRIRALGLGTRTVVLAPLSESFATSTYRLDMSMRDKLKTRVKVAARGVSAIAASLLSIRPTRALALRLADRML